MIVMSILLMLMLWMSYVESTDDRVAYDVVVVVVVVDYSLASGCCGGWSFLIVVVLWVFLVVVVVVVVGVLRCLMLPELLPVAGC